MLTRGTKTEGKPPVFHRIGIWAQTRQELVERVQAGKTSTEPVKMSCGEWIKTEFYLDPPLESLPCPCGDPTHWLVAYGYTDDLPDRSVEESVHGWGQDG